MHWYVIQTKPRQEGRAVEHLERQGYTCYLPTVTVERPRPRSRFEAKEPLFPRYLFIQLDEIDSNWSPIFSTRGVSQMVRCNNQAVSVADHIIDEIRDRTERPNFRLPYLQPGERVRITEGAFTNVEAIFLANDSEQRVVLLMNILHQEQQVEFPLRSIRKIG